jgi:hypothetical protein
MNWLLWRWPLVLGLLTLVGLVSGLVSDGVGDAIAWIGLGVPVWAGLWFGMRRR